MKLVKDVDSPIKEKHKVSDEKAEEAVRTIIQWIGEDSEGDPSSQLGAWSDHSLHQHR